MTTYEMYAWGTADDAARHTGESYERYFEPSIGVPSARDGGRLAPGMLSVARRTSPDISAGLDDGAVQIPALRLRVPPPADFFRRYVRSTPLAGITAELNPEARAALGRDGAERCQPFAKGDAAVFERGLLVATARRS